MVPASYGDGDNELRVWDIDLPSSVLQSATAADDGVILESISQFVYLVGRVRSQGR